MKFYKNNIESLSQLRLVKLKNGKYLSLNVLSMVLLIIYLLMLVYILIFKLGVRFSYMNKRRVSLQPFREYFLYHTPIDNLETSLNCIIFIPAGIYISLLLDKLNFIKKSLIIFMISLCFESTQYIFKIGAFDTTDLITNTMGGILGIIIYILLKKPFNNTQNLSKLVNTTALLATIFSVFLLFLLETNKLPIHYR